MMKSAQSKIKKFIIADLISQLGSSISFISLNWFVFELTGNSLSVGMIMMLGIFGGLLSTLVSGVITDHFNRKNVILFSNFLRALFIFVVILAMMSEQFNLWYAYILSFIGGLGLYIYMPASRALMQELTPQVEITKWQSYLETSVQISLLVAGALTGFLYKYLGMQLILAIELCAFLFSNLVISSIIHKTVVTNVSQEGFYRKFKTGYAYFKLHPLIFMFALVMILPHTVTITLNTIMPNYVAHHLLSDSIVFGFMGMSYGIGGALAGMIVVYCMARRPYPFLIRLFLTLSLLSLAILFFSRSVPIAYLFTFLLGLSGSSIKVVFQSMMMKNIPQDYMGRAMSVINFVSMILQMISTYAVSIFMDSFSSVPGYLLPLLMIAAAFLFFVLLTKKTPLLAKVF